MKIPVSEAKIALIGLGRMGARHVGSIQALGANLVTAFDTATRPYALDVHPRIGDVLTGDADRFWEIPADLTIIASTAASHIGYLQHGIELGRDRFLIEKPLCTSVGEGLAVTELANQAGARVVVNHWRRYSPNFATLDKLRAAGELGSLRSVTISMGAGGMGCVGVHFLERVIDDFGGLPEIVHAYTTGETPANPRGDQFEDPGAFVIMRWSGGERATIEVADDLGIPPFMEYRFTLGRLVIENETHRWRLLRRQGVDLAAPVTRYGLPLAEHDFPGFTAFDLPDANLLAIEDALDDGPVVSGMNGGLNAMLLYAAVRHAMASGEAVTFPLPDKVLNQQFMIP